MSELSLSNAKKLDLISEFVKVVFFLLSNPLYFSYFIFFSPYLYKLFSFLSPLFVTTTLLVSAFLTTTTLSPSLVHDLEASEDLSQGFRLFEEFEVYKIVFEYNSSASEIFNDSEVVKETCSEEKRSTLDSLSPKDEVSSKKIEQVSTKTVAKFEALDGVEGARKGLEFESPESGFEDKCSVKSSDYCDMVDSPRRIENGPSGLGSFGSMRSEKEWRRTLACKLFEERHNNSTVGGSERMDLLWETYETESSKSQGNNMRRNSIKNKGKKSDYNDNGDDDDDDDEDCEDDERNGQLCCLQALKFSAGKMNLGIRKPNLLKFSKALKGMGWIHNVARNSIKKRNNKD